MTRFTSGAPAFSGVRAYLWPVHHYELKKLIPMLLIFFLISFNYNVLRVLKEVTLVHAKGSGAEAIPFVKVGVMLPGTFLMTLLFTRLSNHLSREHTFYVIISSFLLFYAVYLFILYPNRDWLHPDGTADWLETVLPVGAKGLIATLRNWTASAFYAMCELWSNIVLFVLFWGFANQITRLDEAKRFYGLFGVGANLSGVVAGQVSVFFSRGDFNPNLSFGSSAWEQSMIILVTIVLFAGVATLWLLRWMHTNVLSDSRFYNPQEDHLDTQEKPKFSMRDNLRFLLRSQHVLLIAVIVLAYNAVINLTEVMWKDQVNELYSDPNQYGIYMNQVSSLIGLFATFAALFISGNSIRKCGWTFTAMLTPMIMLVTSLGLFGFYFIKEHSSAIAINLMGMTPLALAVFFGSAQNVMSRAAKYSVFDATREMAFIPLSRRDKIKGKAAIDGICSRLGKSGGAAINALLLLIFGSFSSSAPYLAIFLFGTIVIWIIATYLLGKSFASLTGVHAADQTEAELKARESKELTAMPQNALLSGQQAV